MCFNFLKLLGIILLYLYIVEFSTTVVEVDTKVTKASLTPNQCLQCVGLTPPLTHADKKRPRDTGAAIARGYPIAMAP